MRKLRCWAFTYVTKEGYPWITKFDGFDYMSAKQNFLKTFPDAELICEQEVDHPVYGVIIQ